MHHLTKFFQKAAAHHIAMGQSHQAIRECHEAAGEDDLAKAHKALAEAHIAASESCIECGRAIDDEDGDDSKKLTRATYVPDGIHGALPTVERPTLVPRAGSAPIPESGQISEELRKDFGI
jgi:hypothetical protein